MKKFHDLTPAEREFAEAQMVRERIDEATFERWRIARAEAKRNGVPFLFSLSAWHGVWQLLLPGDADHSAFKLTRIDESAPFATPNCQLVPVQVAAGKPLRAPKTPRPPKPPRPRKQRTGPVVGH